MKQKVLLCITGGIAAYKTPILVRKLKEANAIVKVVMTASAQHFVTKMSLEIVSENHVFDQLFDHHGDKYMAHIDLARWADQIIIAPTCAHTLAQLVAGLAPDLLCTLCLATQKPILIFPAMNKFMYLHPTTQNNINILKQRGYYVYPTSEGKQACGDIGVGRLPEPEEMVKTWQQFINQQAIEMTLFKNKKILISAGPTHEYIDPVRYISNPSSGKMGFALAEVAHKMGANVTVITGPVEKTTTLPIQCIRITSALEMFEAITKEINEQDIFISAAAVGDYRVESISSTKIKKHSEALTLNLIKNPDILDYVSKNYNHIITVGFAAETDNIDNNALKKLTHKQLDFLALNDVSQTEQGFQSDFNQLTIYHKQEKHKLTKSSKYQQAEELLYFIANKIK